MSRVLKPVFAIATAASLLILADDSTADTALPDCPALHRVLNEPPGEPFECMCTPEIARTEGTVKLYGSGPYDSVSNICIAAIHAGVTSQDGGPVRVVPRPPEDSFEGTIANGVASEDWGKSLFNTWDVEEVAR